MSNDESGMYLIAVILVLIVCVLRYYIHYTHKNLFISNKKSGTGHWWKAKSSDEFTSFCNICESLCHLTLASYCEYCCIWADKVSCLKEANKSIPCKKWANRNEKTFYHVFQHGNLPNDTKCIECHEEIDYHGEIGLKGTRCIWCKRSYHDLCFDPELQKQICDLGEYKSFIVPPYILKAPKNKLHLSQVISKPPTEFKPLFIIYNKNSGSNDANEIIAGFRSILNSVQILELNNRIGPKRILEFIAKFETSCIILIAGGDGTVGWILSTIQEVGNVHNAEIAILPTGTGNDLSRVLGWGSESDSDVNPYHFLDKIKLSTPTQIDRWVVDIEYDFKVLSKHFHKNRQIFMYNYISIGVDSLITLNFHRARESKFYIFSHRIINKLMYFLYGSQQVFLPECQEIQNLIEVYIDNEELELPNLESVVFLNIDSWGAGVNLHKLANKNKSDYTEMSFSDGILECFGVSSSFHIAQLQMGLSQPMTLGRGKEIRVKIKNKVPVQIDGQPFFQHSLSEIKIKKHSEATVLMNI